MPLVAFLLFNEGKQKFLQAVLVQEDKEETVTLLRETDLFCTFVKQTHQKAAE